MAQSCPLFLQRSGCYWFLFPQTVEWRIRDATDPGFVVSKLNNRIGKIQQDKTTKKLNQLAGDGMKMADGNNGHLSPALSKNSNRTGWTEWREKNKRLRSRRGPFVITLLIEIFRRWTAPAINSISSSSGWSAPSAPWWEEIRQSNKRLDKQTKYLRARWVRSIRLCGWHQSTKKSEKDIVENDRNIRWVSSVVHSGRIISTPPQSPISYPLWIKTVLEKMMKTDIDRIESPPPNNPIEIHTKHSTNVALFQIGKKCLG